MARPNTWDSDRAFEFDVVRVARSLWPSASPGGAIILEGRERDGYFETEESIHILECTVSRSKSKAVDDIDKSTKLGRELRRQHPGKPIQIWFVTAEEPTADQRSVAVSRKEFQVHAVSYNTFRARLIDVSAYLDLRRDYAFGSARNLKDGSPRLERKEYVNLDILCLNDSSIWSPKKVAAAIIQTNGYRAVLLGDYGAGKSMTLREVYLELVDAYQSGTTTKFPVYINLRDHSGQPDPVEILERHARKIGYTSPSHLVRAWRAGYVVLILDGFDELSSAGWAAFNKRLRQVRYGTVEGVRRFLNESQEAAVLVAGRVSYFEDDEECLNAFGLSRQSTAVLSLNDFSEEQIGVFLSRLGVKGNLPHWLPGRPLLVGYLAVRGALDAASVVGGEVDAGAGWNVLLSHICEREARTHQTTDATTVRRIVEHLASIARSKGALSAPLSPTDMINAYRNVVGFEPDEKAETLLMRLPGLGSAERGEGFRAFVDSDFGNAIAAGDLTRFIEDPFGNRGAPVTQVKEVLQEIGIAVSAFQVSENGVPHEKIYVALNEAARGGDNAIPEHALAGDLLKLIATGNYSRPRELPRLNIVGVQFDDLDFSNCDESLSGVVLTDCLVSNLYLPAAADGDDGLPRFIRTDIDHIEGRANAANINQNMFRNCPIASFSEVPATNAAVLEDQGLEPGVKALVIVLRKLFVQKGGGRRENAFYRGVPGLSQKMISEVLELTARAEYAQRNKRGGAEAVWVPNRRMAGRVSSILLSPKSSAEAIVIAARRIGGS
jgi:AraC-like DNA-binding protein